jgi:hypothetical protein
VAQDKKRSEAEVLGRVLPLQEQLSSLKVHPAPSTLNPQPSTLNQANKNRQHDVARNEMLKLILISCSQTLFVTPGQNSCKTAPHLILSVSRKGLQFPWNPT